MLDAATKNVLSIAISGRAERSKIDQKRQPSKVNPDLMGPGITSGFMEALNTSQNFVNAGVYMAKPALSHKSGGGAQMFIGYETDVNGLLEHSTQYWPADYLVVGFNLGPINLDTLGTEDYNGPLTLSIRETGFASYSWTAYTYDFPTDGDLHWLATVEESSNHYLRDILVDGTAVLTGISQDAERARGSGAVSDVMYVGLWQSACTLDGCSHDPTVFDHFPNSTQIQALWENTTRSQSIDPGTGWGHAGSGTGSAYNVGTWIIDPEDQSSANLTLVYNEAEVGPTVTMTP